MRSVSKHGSNSRIGVLFAAQKLMKKMTEIEKKDRILLHFTYLNTNNNFAN